MINKLKEDLKKDFATKEELDKVKDKCKKAKKLAKKATKKAKKNKERSKQNEKDIEELKKMFATKIDCELFDTEINNLKALINQIASSGNSDIKMAPLAVSTGPQISTKELNEFREAARLANLHAVDFKKIAIHEE